MSKQDQPRRFDAILERAIEFHGHYGPFLVMGVRMGLIGLRALNSEKGDKRLQVTAALEYSIPFSCVLDGIQVTTGCTFGNQRLTLKNAPSISAEFQLSKKKQVTVAVNQLAFNEVKMRVLAEKISSSKMEELAQRLRSVPEKDLFVIVGE